jgi:hypothetical protein
MKTLRLLLFAACLPLGSIAVAHHSNDYRRGEAIQWLGTIQTISWDGAHVMYLLEIPNADGSTQRWQVLGASPWRLSKRGISKTTLHVGDVVSVAGYLNRASKMITPVYFARAGKQKLFVGYDSSEAGFKAPAVSLPGAD